MAMVAKALIISLLVVISSSTINYEDYEAFEESCECNVNSEACDYGCCCDSQCSEVDTATFKCKPKSFSDDWAVQPTSVWYPFRSWLTIIKDNSPIISLLYPKLTPINQIDHQHSSKLFPDQVVTASPYTQGTPLQRTLPGGIPQLLRLPWSSGQAKCQDDAIPLLFLEEAFYSCTRIWTSNSLQGLCNGGLNTRRYPYTHINDGSGQQIDLGLRIRGTASTNTTQYQAPTRCLGAVTSAKYTFLWQGARLFGGTLELILTDVNASVDNLDTRVTVQYRHFESNVMDATGIAGYQSESSIRVYNGSSTLDSVMLPTINDKGVCAPGVAAQYGYDSFTACHLPLQAGSACHDQRLALLRQISSLTGLHIAQSRLGVFTNSTWRETLATTARVQIASDAIVALIRDQERCLLPAQATVKMLTTTAGLDQQLIIGSRLSYTMQAVRLTEASIPISFSIDFEPVAPVVSRRLRRQVRAPKPRCSGNTCWHAWLYPVLQADDEIQAQSALAIFLGFGVLLVIGIILCSDSVDSALS